MNREELEERLLRVLPLGLLVLVGFTATYGLYRLRRRQAQSLAAVAASGWARLFVVTWFLWAGWWVHRFVEEQGKRRPTLTEQDLTLYAFVVPPVAALMVSWIVAGFRKNPERVRPRFPPGGLGEKHRERSTEGTGAS
jgi:hypothetical protein